MESVFHNRNYKIQREFPRRAMSAPRTRVLFQAQVTGEEGTSFAGSQAVSPPSPCPRAGTGGASPPAEPQLSSLGVTSPQLWVTCCYFMFMVPPAVWEQLCPCGTWAAPAAGLAGGIASLASSCFCLNFQGETAHNVVRE